MFLLERLLSPRLLHFSRDQIFWDCATLSACEAIPAGLPAVLDEGQTATDRHWRERLQVSAAASSPKTGGRVMRIIGTADDSLPAFWAAAVLFYTSCDITRQSDRLRAVWGIAKLVRDAEREEFGAGLWEQGLAQQLAWRVLGGGGSLVAEDRTHDFPSWSWAAVAAPVRVADRLADYGDYCVTGHDGGALSFKQLEGRVYAGPSEWSDNQPLATTLETEERKLDIGSDITLSVHQSNSDLMPDLQCKALEIQGHVSQGRLSSMVSGDGSTWQIKIQSPAGAKGLIRAFPDRPHETDDLDCLFVVMCAGNGDDDNDEEEFVSDKDDDESGITTGGSWSGNGIMVARNSAMSYTRVGAVEFADLDGDMWAALRHRCCQRTLEDGVHAITDGVKFTLA
ncbi:hypothetical protein PG994_005009 [Apiospora phragmitis]|uniref:Uncharacterized protein n=1 Tax=Apiospora phragmitis TaxID=2905665 RepID=A0ABR1VS76_9PEZI